MLQLATISTALSIPKSIGALSEIASAFNLGGAHWKASPPISSAFDLLTTPTNGPSDTTAWLSNEWNVSTAKLSNTRFAVNPFDRTDENLVLSTEYPKNTRDGDQFFMTPMRVDSNVQTAVLQYEVSHDFDNPVCRSRTYCTSESAQANSKHTIGSGDSKVAFDTGFDFVKGGKLPGLYGSEQGAEGVCSGGNRQPSCWSARLMWRAKGEGEVYAYVPMYPGFCRQSDVLCNDIYGISLSRNSFEFAAGGWTTITQLVSLNTPGYANGLLYLWANGSLALAHTGIVWRVAQDVKISKIMFSTFFGGSDSSWNSHGGRSYFRNFEVYAGQMASNTSGPAVNATLAATSSSPATLPSNSRLLSYSLILGIVTLGLV